MLFRSNGNKLLELLNTFWNTVSVRKVWFELVPLVWIGRFYEFLSLVSKLEINLNFFSEEGSDFCGLGFGDFDLMKLNGELLFGSGMSFLFELSWNLKPKRFVFLLLIHIHLRNLFNDWRLIEHLLTLIVNLFFWDIFTFLCPLKFVLRLLLINFALLNLQKLIPLNLSSVFGINFLS